MSNHILEALYESYISGELGDIESEETQEERDFRDEYIKPLREKSFKTGDKMQDMFNSALVKSGEQDFFNGIKACMRLIRECFQER